VSLYTPRVYGADLLPFDDDFVVDAFGGHGVEGVEDIECLRLRQIDRGVGPRTYTAQTASRSSSALDDFDSPDHVALLSILAATQDYQLAGDAQLFWQTLDETLNERDRLSSVRHVNETLADFLEEPVNSRLRG
jgi:hypothetical protein